MSGTHTVVIRLCKSHRIAVYILSGSLILFSLAAMMLLVSFTEFRAGMKLLLCAAAILPLLPLPLYFAAWQITFHKGGIRRRLFWIHQENLPWTQVAEVRATWSAAERNRIIRIRFRDGKTIRFRMDCENAEKARRFILSHCSITE